MATNSSKISVFGSLKAAILLIFSILQTGGVFAAPIAEADSASRPAREWTLGTNVIGWGMAIANATGEVTFAPRWSAALSIYYSAWNYGSSRHKYRTFIFRPEARYWLREALDGFYIQAHLQMAAYNFAQTNWRYRIQDVGGKHPALGGGFGAGYRLTPCNGRWAFDFAVGAGVYHLKYDKFENRAGGQWVGYCSRTWFGLDNVSVGIVYNFNSPVR